MPQQPVSGAASSTPSAAKTACQPARAPASPVVSGQWLSSVTASTPDAARRFTALARRGVLTRPFSDQPTWLRFGLPKPKDWPRLQSALEGSRR